MEHSCIKKYHNPENPDGVYILPILEHKEDDPVRYFVLVTSYASEKFNHLNGFEFQSVDQAQTFLETAFEVLRQEG